MRGWRGFAAGALTLIAMQVLGTGKGPEQGGKLLVWGVAGMRRLMSPDVPGIPRAGKAPPAAKPSTSKPDTGGVRGELPRNPLLQA